MCPSYSRRRGASRSAAGLVAVLLLAGCGSEPGTGTDEAPAPEGPPSSSSTAGSAQPSPSAGNAVRLRAPVAIKGRCMVPSPEVLRRADTAFEGTVESVSDRRVTLRPTRWFAGGPGERVVVTASPQGSLPRLVQEVRFEEGGDYFVAANGGTVMVCGFSAPATSGVEGLYAEAFPG